MDRGWWKENFAVKLKRPKVTDPPTMPYTRKEIVALLAACDEFTDWHGHTGRHNARRLRAFVLFIRYSALRIGDATSCPVDRLVGEKSCTPPKPVCPSTFRFHPLSWRH